MKTLTLPLLAWFALVASAFAGSDKVADISHDDLKAAIASGDVFLIDVNGARTYKEGHIPGAINFALHGDKLASLLPADKSALVVAYCGSEKCGAYKRAVKAAEKLGYTNVKHYSKGIAGWKKSGEKTESDT